jgi:hypothetical protein
MRGDSVEEKSCIAFDQEDSKPLEQVSDLLTLVLSCGPSLGFDQLSDLVHGSVVPATQSLYRQWNEADPLHLADSQVVPALIIEGERVWLGVAMELVTLSGRRGLTTVTSNAVSRPPVQWG